MKRLLALILCIMTVCAFCTAENAQKTLTDFDMGDFTIALDANATVEVNQKADGEVLLLYYPELSEEANCNFNVIWTNSYTDMKQFEQADAEKTAEAFAAVAVEQFLTQGVKATDCTVHGSAIEAIDGLPALVFIYSVAVDYSGIGLDYQSTLYFEEAIVSDNGLGTYTFTGTAESLEDLQTLIDPIFDTIRWNK